MSSRGLQAELRLSNHYHSQNTAVLISSKLLRSYNCGQVDIAYMIDGNFGPEIVIVESKSSQIGIQGLNRGQIYRLYAAQNFISRLFDLPVRLDLGERDVS